MLDSKKLAEIEFVSRALMALILITAGTSKFLSGGGFAAWYSGQFANPDLRINVSEVLISLYLNLIPFIEVGLGACLLIVMLKRYTIYAWYLFMASLLVGHYILQEWSAVNQMLAYFFLGMICHALPTHAELNDRG